MAILSTFPGTVVLGDSNKKVYFVNNAGTVNTAPLQAGNLTSPPAYYGGVAYFGEGTGALNSWLHAFKVQNATDYWGPSGIQLNGSVDATPVISQDLVLYVAASNGALYAIDIQDAANPNQLWTLPVFTRQAAVTALFMSAGGRKLYLLTAGALYAVALQGRSTAATLLWQASAPASFTGAILNDHYLIASAGSSLYGFDTHGTASGGVLPSKWAYSAGQALFPPMNLDCVHALVGDASGSLHVVRMSDGACIGTFNPGLTSSAIQKSVLLDGQSLISVTSSGTLGQTKVALTQHFGVEYSPGWSTPVSGATFSSAPFVGDGVVYAASDQGTLYSLDAYAGGKTGQQSLTGSGMPTSPFGPPQVVPYVASSTASVGFLLDGYSYFTTMKNLLLATKNGNLNSGASPPSPPTFENLVTAVGAAGYKAYVLMWDTSTVSYVMEQGDLRGGLSMLASAQNRLPRLVNAKTACNLEFEANVSVYLEPYPDVSKHSYWSDVYRLGKIGVLSQHQKMAVFCVNGTKLALVSGLNIGPSDYDTSGHPMDATDATGKHTYNGRHDTAVILMGTAASTVEAEFDRRWAKSGGSSASPGTASYAKIAGWAIHHDMCLDCPDACSGGGAPSAFQNPSPTGPAVPVEVLITNSDYPTPIRQIQKEMVDRIGAAQTYVYIENFTLHDIAVVEALSQKLADMASACLVIVMLPHPPIGEAAQEPMIRCTYALLLLSANAWTQLTYESFTVTTEYINGMQIPVKTPTGPTTIQSTQVTNVQFSFGESVYDTRVTYQQGGSTQEFYVREITSMTPVATSSSSRLLYCSPARYFGTVQADNTAGAITGWPANYRGVYIHSKLALFDDASAIIGSGNFNGRSMMYDGEMSVLVDDTTTAAAIRSALFSHWGVPSTSAGWYSAMNAFATSPTAGSIGVLPLAFGALSSTWPRKAFTAAFDVLGLVDPGSVL